jgi:ABC-type sugar transport system substrate-binding protein
MITGFAFAQDKPMSVSVLEKYTNLDGSGNPINKNLKIAFAQTDLNTPWRVSEMENFKFWAKKLGVNNFIFNDANEQVSKQLSNVADLLAQKPDVIIVDPMATEPLTPVVEMAQKAGIPLIVVDRALSVGPGAGSGIYKAFIGANQFVIGYQSTLAWIAKLKTAQKTKNPKGGLVILAGGVGQQPAIERTNGIKAAIKDYPGLTILAEQSGDWTRDGGLKVMQSYIQRFPAGKVQGCFAASDEMMLGALQALKAANRKDLNGWFFTGDGQLEGLQAIIDGINIADTQNPPFYGQSSLEAAIATSQGVKLPSQNFELVNETFSSLTADDMAKTKAYLAQITLQGLQF